MHQPKHTQLDIATASARTVSPEHKRFQTLLAKIEKARARLHSWHEQLPLFAQAHQARVAPLRQQLASERRSWALELEALQLAHKWSRADRATLSELICDICGGLLDAEQEPDAEIKALYNRHADIDFDTDDRQQLDQMKALLESIGGVDLGDAPVQSAEELMQRARASVAQEREQAEAAKPGHSRKTARKPARKTVAQKRAEEDEQRISQTVREVYRKLASALHPDRLGADMPEAERQASTARMQRANAAYESGDLLALLELQLQIEQVDLTHAANVAAEQVRHFNKVLTEQLRELQAEIDGRQHAFCASYGLMTQTRLDPDQLGLLLKDETRALITAQTLLERDRRLLRRDPAQMKQFLRQWRAQQREQDWDLPF